MQEIQKIFDFYLNNEPVANQSQRIAMTEILSDNIFTFETLVSSLNNCTLVFPYTYFAKLWENS